MKKRGWLFFLPLLFLGNAFPGAVPGYKVETIAACTNPEVGEAVQKVLSPQGLRITGSSGVFCEIWFRKIIPQKAGSSGTAYNTVPNGAFIGVITYSSKAGDYRGQGIKAGTYTMRFGTIPQDGNHVGASPLPEFFLLSPAAADKNPDDITDFQELVNLSKKASGTNHPSPLNLALPAAEQAPAFRETDEGHAVLETKVKAKPAGGGAEVDFRLGVVLIGKAEG